MSGLANYKILGPLGSGTFGQVKLAEHTLTSSKVALKILKKRTISEKRIVSKVKREIKVLKWFHHPNIIRIYEVIDTPSSFVLVLEYLSGGELYNFLDRNGKLCENQARRYISQVLLGLEYIHTHRLAHRDIKPENLLLDDAGDLKIADFGLSNMMRDGEYLKTSCGSPNYAAPEIIAGLRYCGHEVDIWSTGVVLYTLLAGYLPFDDGNLTSLFTKIKSASFNVPYHFSATVKDLIFRMLNPDPIARITMNQIKCHPWFKGSVSLGLKNRIKYIDIDRNSKNILETPIDEEVLEECIKYIGSASTDLWEIRENIIKKIDCDHTVCYYLLLDKRLSAKITAEASIKPIFKLKSLENITDSSTRSSSRSEFIEPSLRSDIETPSNWVYGFRSNLEVSSFMINIFNSFKDSGLQWKIIDTLYLSMRTIDPKKQVKMSLKIYKYEESFVLDFKLRSGNYMIFLEVLHKVYYFLYLRTCY